MASTTRRSRRTPSPPPAPLTPHELAAAPELAVLAALQHLIELTTLTLVAVHPDLISDRSSLHPLDAQTVLADKLIQLSSRLANAVTCYHIAALASLRRPDSDDLPF